jgi:SAM-dependent methyltransferase
MPNEKARQIIRDAMENRDIYDAMAAKEKAVWSRLLTNEHRTTAQIDDVKAREELNATRFYLDAAATLKAHDLRPEHGLSLGCGSGRAERAFLEKGICRSFYGIDIAEGAINQARQTASANSLPLTYEVQDLNFPEFPADTYDLVLAQTCIHHIVQLERLADEIFKTLKPGGVLWLQDYIGETQFQFTDDRLSVFNALIDILPERLRYSHISQTIAKRATRRTPGTLVSPFESIRSAEIPEIFLARFTLMEKAENHSFFQRVLPSGTLVNYLENDDTRTLFEVLLYFDMLLVDKGVLPAIMGQYLLQKPAA